MNTVTVTGFGLLKEYLPGEVTVNAGQTAGEAIEGLQLGLTDAIALVVNGRVVSWDHPLEPGDRLQLVPAIGGG